MYARSHDPDHGTSDYCAESNTGIEKLFDNNNPLETSDYSDNIHSTIDICS